MLSLRPYQRSAIDSVYVYWGNGGGNPLVELATGCHARGTSILMHDGSVKLVEDVVAGDLLMGPDSQPRQVLRLARGRERMARVIPIKGEPFVVNMGHMLSLVRTARAGGDTYASHRGGGVDSISVRDWIEKSKTYKHLHKLRRVAVSFPPLPEPDIPAWIMGVLLGDGCVAYGASICNPDQEVLDGICDYAEDLGLRLRISQKTNNKAYDVHFVDDEATSTTPNRLMAKLRDIGAAGCVADSKFIPDIYKLGSEPVRLEVLAGILDTDGSLSTGCFDFISKSERLSRDVVFVARSLGLAAYIKRAEKFCQTGGGGTYWRVSISGDIDIIPMRVPRKRAPKRQQKKSVLVTGFDVEPLEEDDFFGFELDGDHLYLTADFTVHHNTGKSLVAATFCKELLERWPDMRIGVVAHVKELIEQNAKEMIRLWPQAPIGIYSAGVGRKDRRAKLLFCGIQSIYNKLSEVGGFDLLIIDEAHMIPRKSATRYGQFIHDCRQLIPEMRIVGLTATPYRLDSGRLDEGNEALFDQTVFRYGIAEGVRDGHLSPLISKATLSEINVDNVAVRGGEFVALDLQAAALDPLNIKANVSELVQLGQDRRAWLIFCTGVSHAWEVAKEIRSYAVGGVEVVSGETNKTDRDRIIKAYCAGQLRCLVNVNVLTTGFNAPHVDLVGMMRPTLSTGLYVQMLGRGTRLAEGKENCLVLDWARNVKRHGPVDRLHIRDKSKKAGRVDADDENAKVCPECTFYAGLEDPACPQCGYAWPVRAQPEPTSSGGSDRSKLDKTADDEHHVMGGNRPQWLEVREIDFAEHPAKPGKAPTMRVEYFCGPQSQREWVCFEHTGFARQKAEQWWRRMGGQDPVPRTVAEALQRTEELDWPREICVRPDGDFMRVVGRKMPEREAA
jgi:superfamily II DNA or RNA helicase